MKLKKINELSKRQKLIVFPLIVFAVLLILYFSLSFLSSFLKSTRNKKDFSRKSADIEYFPVDYDEDIMNDIVYLEKDRDIYYSEFGETIDVSLKDSHIPDGALIFIKYFGTLIEGKCEEHRKLFTKEFFDDYIIPERFTAQKIYDIRIMLTDRTASDSDGSVIEYFTVEYKIKDNNGTYRADVKSNENVPLEFKIIRFNTSASIAAIIERRIKPAD